MKHLTAADIPPVAMKTAIDQIWQRQINADSRLDALEKIQDAPRLSVPSKTVKNVTVGGTLDPATISHNILQDLTVGDPHTQYVKMAVLSDMEAPTGFVNRTDSSISFVDGTRTFTVTGSAFEIYINGVRHLKNTESIVITNTVGLWYIYYNSVGVLTASQTLWGFEAIVFLATVYWNGANAIIGDERHGIAMDWATHKYLHETVGTRYENGLTLTVTNAESWSMTAGELHDEDIEHIIGASTTARLFYMTPSGYTFTAVQAALYHDVADIIQYNNGTALANVSNNKYTCSWVFATNDPTSPIAIIMGQSDDNTLVIARTKTYDTLSLGTLPSAEMKILYRVILRRSGTGVTYVETQDLRSISNMPSGTFVATSHGSLSGLANDDHPQYLLTDGARALTGDWDIGDTRYLAADKIRARDAAGLSLYNDGGFGIDVNDNDTVKIGALNGLILGTSGVLSAVTDNRANWDTAYGWGNHAGLYTPIAHKTTEDALNGLVKVNGVGSYSAITDNSANWDTAYGWGNHAGLYTPLAHKTTEDALNGLVKVDGAGNYSAITDNSANWNTASSSIFWARNSGSGYLYPNTLTDKVGIGINVPSTSLHVVGQTLIDNITPATAKNILTLNISGTNYGHFYDVGAGNILALGGSAVIGTVPTAPIMAWDLDARTVGIGTIAAATQFDIVNLEANCREQLISYSSTASHDACLNVKKSHSDTETLVATINDESLGGLQFFGVNSGSAFTQAGYLKCFQNGSAGATYNAADMIFALGTNAAGPTEKMRLTSNGLGVGVTVPVDKLEVAGGIRVTSTMAGGTGASWGAMDYDVSTGYMQFLAQGKDNTTRGGYLFSIREKDTGNNIDALTIDTTGFLGIGITPSYKLDVNGSARICPGEVDEFYIMNRAAGTVLAIDDSIAGLVVGVDPSPWNTAYGWGDHASGGYFKADGSTPADIIYLRGTNSAVNPYVQIQNMTSDSEKTTELRLNVGGTGSFKKYVEGHATKSGLLEIINSGNFPIHMISNSQSCLTIKKHGGTSTGLTSWDGTHFWQILDYNAGAPSPTGYIYMTDGTDTYRMAVEKL